MNIIESVRKVRQLFFPHLETLFTTEEATVKLVNGALSTVQSLVLMCYPE